jgi:hypothetical protein
LEAELEITTIGKEAESVRRQKVDEPSWFSRCAESIRKERVEAEKRYGIKIGQTDIYCARCGRPWGLGGHTCQDTRLKELQLQKKEKNSELEKTENEALIILGQIGAKKAAIHLMIPEWTVKKWLQRRSIPANFGDKILNFKKYV